MIRYMELRAKEALFHLEAAGGPTRDLPETYEIFEPTVQLKPEKIYIRKHSRIDSFCKLEGGLGLIVGEHVHISSFSHIGCGGGLTIIGDHVAIASSVKVISGTNSLESPFCSVVSDGCVVRHNVTEIKRQAFLMAGSIVLPGVTVHEGAALASGAVATQDIPEWEVWAGVPAKFVRKRRFREGVPA